MSDLNRAAWFKSRRSTHNGNCVEVAFLDAGAVAVRDSKDPHGPVLTLGAGVWRELVADVKAGRL